MKENKDIHPIDDLFRQSLEGYTSPPPPGAWKNIRLRIDKGGSSILQYFTNNLWVSLLSAVILSGSIWFIHSSWFSSPEKSADSFHKEARQKNTSENEPSLALPAYREDTSKTALFIEQSNKSMTSKKKENTSTTTDITQNQGIINPVTELQPPSGNTNIALKGRQDRKNSIETLKFPGPEKSGTENALNSNAATEVKKTQSGSPPANSSPLLPDSQGIGIQPIRTEAKNALWPDKTTLEPPVSLIPTSPWTANPGEVKAVTAKQEKIADITGQAKGKDTKLLPDDRPETRKETPVSPLTYDSGADSPIQSGGAKKGVKGLFAGGNSFDYFAGISGSIAQVVMRGYAPLPFYSVNITIGTLHRNWGTGIETGLGISRYHDHGIFEFEFLKMDTTGYNGFTYFNPIDSSYLIIFKPTISEEHIFKGATTKTSCTYLSIPLYFSQQLFQSGKLAMSIKAGPSVNIMLTKKEVQPILNLPGAKFIRLSDKSYTRLTTNWQLLVATRFSWQLTDHISFLAEPAALFYLDNLYDKNSRPSSKPYGIGIWTGFQYKF